MAWIKTVTENEATGSTRQQYDAAVKRAGRVYNIVKISSLKPEIMRTFIQLYMLLMHGQSGLSRTQREMIAVTVSVLNKCRY